MLLALLFSLIPGVHYAQQDKIPYRGYDFIPPMGIPVSLSGNFGELRTNHFHAGLDIRTQGRKGIPVRSVGDGHVVRIKISPYGYGNVLYIQHPNGYTSVYAHLLEFNKEIEAFVRKVQESRKTFAIQLFPGRTELTVSKGDTIALSGNSGSTGGPHLHFEVRDTRSGLPINPLLFDFIPIRDNRKPRPRYLKIYPQDEKSLIRVSYPDGRTYERTHAPIKLKLTGDAGQYHISKNPVLKGAGRLGFGIEAYDYHNSSGFRLGIYDLKVLHNGQQVYGHKMEKVSFFETRYVNSHMDYREKTRYNNRFMCTHLDPGNRLSIYNGVQNRGLIQVQKADTHRLQFVLTDEHGNRSTVGLKLLKTALPVAQSEATMGPKVERYLPYDAPSTYLDEGIRVRFRANTFYQKIPFTYKREDTIPRKFSPTYVVHDPMTPVHRRYTLSLDGSGVPRRLRNKAVIVRSDHYQRRRSEGGSWQGNWLSARPRYFGKFFIDVDTIQPRIRPINIYNDKYMGRSANIRVAISDNLSGIDAYYPTIDGKWALMEFDGKYALLKHTFTEDLAPGKHVFKLKVTDNVGNVATIKIPFRR